MLAATPYRSVESGTAGVVQGRAGAVRAVVRDGIAGCAHAEAAPVPAPDGRSAVRTLIAYASRYGSTREIAEAIGEVLDRRGVAADVRPAAEVAKLEGYDAVVLGSALYGGGWLDDAVEFLESFQEELARRSVWLFSSGPTEAGDPVAALGGWRFPEELAPLAGAIGARDTALFAGRIDPDQLSMQDWLINRSMRGAGGDFRDFAQIRTWAANVAHALSDEAGDAVSGSPTGT